MTRERRQREDFQRQVEEDCAGTERADAAVAEDVECALAIASCAERGGRVGESVEMNGTGDDPERDEDKHRANRLREDVREQPIYSDEREPEEERDDREPCE